MNKDLIKKIKAAAAVLMTVMLSVGCGGSETNDVSNNGGYVFTADLTENFVFPEISVDGEAELINSFAVMNDNKTALILDDTGSSRFAVYENGKSVSQTEISPFYREMCYNFDENCFYTYNSEKKQLHIMDENFNFKEVLADNFETFEIKNMDVVDNKLYLIATKKDPYDEDTYYAALDEKTGYLNFDEKVYSIDLSTKEIEELGIRNVICQSYSNDTLYFYTCRDGHYSLDIYDRETKTLKAVKNTDEVGYIYSFAIIGEEMMYIRPGDFALSKINLNSGETLLEPDMVFIVKNSDFEVYKGSLIILNRNDMSIIRRGGNTGSISANEKLAQFNGENIVIGDTTIYTSINTRAISSKCGISASIYEYPMYDKDIKLKLLAGDSDVDIYIFSSVRRTGIDIRRMGCYVPLTDEAILNKRDQYFDYLQDYTVNDNGEIWCVPIRTYTYATFYVPDNLKALGIEPEQLSTFDGYFSALETVKSQDRYKFYGNTLDFADTMTNRYNVNYSYLNFNNELFRNMFERIYSGWIIWSNPNDHTDVHPLFNNIMMSDDWRSKLKADNMAFTIEFTSSYTERIENPGDWRAMALPTLSSPDEKNPVSVEYAIINPFSEKKEAAEAYLGFIAENNLDYIKDKSFLFKDKALYGNFADEMASCFDGLYELFENGEVHERVISMNEGFREDVIAYQNGETTLDEYIAELERVAETAANE